MNTLQPVPNGAQTAPPVSFGGKASGAEASSFAKKAPVSLPSFGPAAAPSTSGAKPASAEEQLASARAATIKAADERKAQAEKAAAAAKEAAEAKKQAAELASGALEREVGLVEGTLKVFIDLVEPESKRSLFRVFGPEDAQKPKQEDPAPKNAGATAAYTRAAPVPLKDVGVA